MVANDALWLTTDAFVTTRPSAENVFKGPSAENVVSTQGCLSSGAKAQRFHQSAQPPIHQVQREEEGRMNEETDICRLTITWLN